MQKPGNQTAAAAGKPITTFVQTDTNAFRDIVQRLTGPSENDPTQLAATAAAAISKVAGGSKRSTSKLHERRHNLTRPKLEIVKPPINFKTNLTSPTSHSRSSSLHPSPVGTPSTVFSKLTLQEQENKGSESPSLFPDLNCEEEEKAIKERRFYLHPSPRSRQGSAHELPELLTLFPLSSTENERTGH